MTKYVENEREEISAEVYHEIPPKEKLEIMSDITLAELHASFSSDKPGLIIVQNEWRRRDKLEQYRLSKDLVQTQNRTTIIASIFGITGTIVGAILGVILAQLLK